jgi:serine protease Do
VKMNDVDRNIFDFDRDVPYLAVILNGDGTIYGRWGTRTSTSRSDLPRHTIGSLRTALETALTLHEGYPANRAELAAKNNQRIETPSFPEELSTMKPHQGNPPEVRNCIHCHMVGEAKLVLTLQAGKPSLNDLWPYPSADNLGLRLDFADGLKVKSVVRGSIGDVAGVRAGDKLHGFERQRLVSEADLQWALHHLADDAQPKLTLLRDGEPVEVTLALTGEWRKGPVEWRESVTPARPHVHLRPQFGKDKLGIAADEMALSVNYPRLDAAKAGLRNGDIVISVDGRKNLHTEADFLKYIHLDRPDARSVELGVLRKGERLTITLPLR